jgi:hypothetical protein
VGLDSLALLILRGRRREPAMTITTLLSVSLLANVILFFELRHAKKRLEQYEFVTGPKILTIPLPLRPCPDCAEPLWGGIAVGRIFGVDLVTAIAPTQVKTDGTPVTKQIDAGAQELERRCSQSDEVGWCDRCQHLVTVG